MSAGVLHNIIPHPNTTYYTHLSVILTTMGRGRNWDADENEILAKKWIETSEEPVTGTN